MRVDAYHPVVYDDTFVEGLRANETIASVDYWQGPSGTYLLAMSNQARLYKLSERSVDPMQYPSVPIAALNGTKISMDCEPVTKLVRVVTNAGENLRVDATNGAVTFDSPLAYAAGDVNEGATPNIVALAHTEPLAETTRTTTYAIDATRDQLVRIGGLHGSPSANGGVLATVGELGVDVGDDTGFDISAGGTALIAAGSELRTVNLATGATRRVSSYAVTPPVQSLAIWIEQNVSF